jgi:hypothetical protein
MKRIISVAAKLSVLVGLGAGLWLTDTYSDNHTAERSGAIRSEGPAESEATARATAAEQRLSSLLESCASETWPNISPECIAGQAEPVRRTDKPVASGEPPSSILLRPTRLPYVAPLEPEGTGSLPTVVATPEPGPLPKKVVRSRAPTKLSKQPVSEPRAPRPVLREAKRPPKQRLPATAPEPAPHATAPIGDPIQFRLADRGN